MVLECLAPSVWQAVSTSSFMCGYALTSGTSYRYMGRAEYSAQVLDLLLNQSSWARLLHSKPRKPSCTLYLIQKKPKSQEEKPFILRSHAH